MEVNIMKVNQEFVTKLKDMVSNFKKNLTFELEAKYYKTLNLSDFTNVVKFLRSYKKDEFMEKDTLDIFIKDQNIRISLIGIDPIQKYCKTNIISIEDTIIIEKKR